MFEALSRLTDEWNVFHSVVWQGIRSGRQADGEADFVLIHPRRGLVVLEVKGGRVDVEGGEWYSADHNGVRHRIKNPFVQALASKHSLLRYLNDRHPGLAVSIGHGVVFPDVSIETDIGLYGPRPLILDRHDLRNPPAAIERLCDHWTLKARLTPSQVRAVASGLAPTANLRTRLRDVLRESEETLLQLTNQQVAVFRQLRRMRRVAVVGGAGTGKTILAVERARQLAADYQTLLVCYNEPLATHISKALPPTQKLTVATFHSLCFKAAKALGEVPTTRDAYWWENVAPNVLQRFMAGSSEPIGALVVDEVQDLCEPWLTSLLLLLEDPDESPCYLFGDTHQRLYRGASGMPPDFPQFTLDINCRNTLPIARRVAAVFGDLEPEHGADGAAPTFIRADSSMDLIEAVQDLVSNLLSAEQLRPDQIVVLSNDARVRQALRARLAADSAFVGLSEHGVVAETIARFKGLEAPVVVLALTNSVLTNQDEMRATVYVGLSRARSALFVISSADVKRALKW